MYGDEDPCEGRESLAPYRLPTGFDCKKLNLRWADLYGDEPEV